MKHSFHPAIRVTALSKCATAILLLLMLAGGSTTASSVSARAGAPDEATAMSGLAGPGSLSVVQVTTSPADDASPALVQTADGKLLAVFVRNGELWSRASTDEGAIWASETRIDGCCRSNPSLARAADGTLWLIYDIERVIEIEIAPGVVEVKIIREIWHRISADGGVTWSEASRFATDASDANSDTNASMFQAANGELWAVWVSNRTGNADLWYKTRGNASATWSADTRLTTSSADDYAPAITQAADGRLVVVWSRGDGVLVQRSSTDGGATWSVERQIAGCCRRDPSLAAVGGVLWLAYEEDEDIWYRTSTNQGANWSVATPFTRFAKNDGGVTLAALASGEPGLAWHSIRSGNQDIWFGAPGYDDPGPPYIEWIEHRPQCNLDSNATITFRARALDETGVAGVHLVWTLNGDAQADLEMYDDGDSEHGDEVAGDDVWAVRHAPLPADSDVTYRACVTDTEGNSYCHPGWNSFTVLPAFVTGADILFVPDAGGGDTSWFRSYHTNALDAQGYMYDTWDTGRRCAPDSAILNQYIGGTVIWSAPNWNSYITGDSAQPAAVQSYLDAGGRLFITGQNVAQNLTWYGGANFLNNYLHATFRREDSGQYAVVCDDLVLNISGGDGANNQYSKDAVDPLTPAEVVCTYQTGANAMLAEPIRPAEERPTGPQDLPAAPTLGTPAPAATPAPPTVAPPTPTPAPPIDPYTAGLRVDTGVYKVVYFAFGFEAINSAAHRAEMLGRVLSWLTGKMVLLAPANEQTVPAGPVAFRWTDVGAAAYEIQIDAVDTFDSPDLIDEIVDGASYTHSFTALGARYWRVRARFNDDWGDWTTIRSFSVAAGAVQATTDPADDASPALVQTADGKLLTVFVRNGSLWSRASTDGGATWAAETQIAGCCRYNPSLARAADGTLWLAYDRDGAIWYRTSADGGVTWGAEQQIPTDLAVNSDPVIFHAADGKLWAVWQSYSPSYGCGGIRYATSANHGATWSAVGQLFQHGYCSQTPAATVAADGRLVVVWIWDGELWQRSSTDDGATWSEERRIAFWPRSRPSLAAVGEVLWLVYKWDGDIWYRTSTDQGENWSDETRFTRFVGGDDAPGTAALASGSAGIVWQSDRSGNPDIWFGIPGEREDLNPPPYVSDIEHRPTPNPDSDDIITFRAAAQDETRVAGVRLVWTLNGGAQGDLEMNDKGAYGDEAAGDGVWGVQLGPLPEGSRVTYRAIATDADGNSYRYPGLNSFEVLPAFVKTAGILFVPDAGGNNTPSDTGWFRPYYTDALEALGYRYDTWDTALRGKPGSAILNQYRSGAVIWAVPYWGYLTDYGSDSIGALQTYLGAGGKLFITGQNIAEGLYWTDFLENTLHATVKQGDAGLYALAGAAGDPIGDGLGLNISGGDGANDQYSKDEIDPIDPAQVVFTYRTDASAMLAEPIRPAEEALTGPADASAAPAAPGASVTAAPAGNVGSGTAGLRVDVGAYKVVYFAFGFEAINRAADRRIVMERVLSWLEVRLPFKLYLPLVFADQPSTAVSFWADRYQLQLGECTSIHWSAMNVREVYLDGVGVAGQAARQVCPAASTTYVLRVVFASGAAQEHRLTILVYEDLNPTPTPAPEPTAAPATPTRRPTPIAAS